jgi:hypothetical protein
MDFLIFMGAGVLIFAGLIGLAVLFTILLGKGKNANQKKK